MAQKSWISRQSARIEQHHNHWFVYNKSNDPVAVYPDKMTATSLKEEIERMEWLKNTEGWIWDKRKKRASAEETPLYINMLQSDIPTAGLTSPKEYPPKEEFKGDVKPRQMDSPASEVMEKENMPGFESEKKTGYEGSGKRNDEYDGAYDDKLTESNAPETGSNPGGWASAASLRMYAALIDKDNDPVFKQLVDSSFNAVQSQFSVKPMSLEDVKAVVNGLAPEEYKDTAYVDYAAEDIFDELVGPTLENAITQGLGIAQHKLSEGGEGAVDLMTIADDLLPEHLKNYTEYVAKVINQKIEKRPGTNIAGPSGASVPEESEMTMDIVKKIIDFSYAAAADFMETSSVVSYKGLRKVVDKVLSENSELKEYQYTGYSDMAASALFDNLLGLEEGEGDVSSDLEEISDKALDYIISLHTSGKEIKLSQENILKLLSSDFLSHHYYKTGYADILAALVSEKLEAYNSTVARSNKDKKRDEVKESVPKTLAQKLEAIEYAVESIRRDLAQNVSTLPAALSLEARGLVGLVDKVSEQVGKLKQVPEGSLTDDGMKSLEKSYSTLKIGFDDLIKKLSAQRPDLKTIDTALRDRGQELVDVQHHANRISDEADHIYQFLMDLASYEREDYYSKSFKMYELPVIFTGTEQLIDKLSAKQALVKASAARELRERAKALATMAYDLKVGDEKFFPYLFDAAIDNLTVKERQKFDERLDRSLDDYKAILGGSTKEAGKGAFYITLVQDFDKFLKSLSLKHKDTSFDVVKEMRKHKTVQSRQVGPTGEVDPSSMDPEEVKEVAADVVSQSELEDLNEQKLEALVTQRLSDRYKSTYDQLLTFHKNKLKKDSPEQIKFLTETQIEELATIEADTELSELAPGIRRDVAEGVVEELSQKKPGEDLFGATEEELKDKPRNKEKETAEEGAAINLDEYDAEKFAVILRKLQKSHKEKGSNWSPAQILTEAKNIYKETYGDYDQLALEAEKEKVKAEWEKEGRAGWDEDDLDLEAKRRYRSHQKGYTGYQKSMVSAFEAQAKAKLQSLLAKFPFVEYDLDNPGLVKLVPEKLPKHLLYYYNVKQRIQNLIDKEKDAIPTNIQELIYEIYDWYKNGLNIERDRLITELERENVQWPKAKILAGAKGRFKDHLTELTKKLSDYQRSLKGNSEVANVVSMDRSVEELYNLEDRFSTYLEQLRIFAQAVEALQREYNDRVLSITNPKVLQSPWEEIFEDNLENIANPRDLSPSQQQLEKMRPTYVSPYAPEQFGKVISPDISLQPAPGRRGLPTKVKSALNVPIFDTYIESAINKGIGVVSRAFVEEALSHLPGWITDNALTKDYIMYALNKFQAGGIDIVEKDKLIEIFNKADRALKELK